MNSDQRDAFISATIGIVFVVCFIAVITWFISLSIQKTERQRLKHEYCYSETTRWTDQQKGPMVKVNSYCGYQNEEFNLSD